MESPFEEIYSENRVLLKKYLDESKSRCGIIFSDNQDAILALDLYGNCVDVNTTFEKMSYYSIEDAKQMKLQSFVPIEDLDKMFHYFHKSLLGQVQNYDCKMIDKKRRILDLNITNIPIVVDHQIVGIYAVAKDVTHFKKKKEEVRKIEAFHRILTENILDVIVHTNLQGDILYVSPACTHILGYISNEMYNQKYLSFIHTDDREQVSLNLQCVFSKQENGRCCYQFRKKDGSFVWVEALCKPVIDPDTSDVLEVVTVIRDITERKRTEDLLLNSEKLNVAGKLAAGIAHEVRNPLTVVKGFIQLMREQTDKKTYFDIIQSEVDRIEIILSELLVLAKPHNIKFQEVNVKALMDDVKTLINPQALVNNVEIEMVNECENCKIRCNENQLKQVFINFLKNGIEAMENGGLITIEIKKHRENKLNMRFKDTGSGIPPSILERIGEPFFTTKANGTGLGVMVSKQIIETHKGSVQFMSDKKGTIVEVILPLIYKE